MEFQTEITRVFTRRLTANPSWWNDLYMQAVGRLVDGRETASPYVATENEEYQVVISPDGDPPEGACEDGTQIAADEMRALGFELLALADIYELEQANVS